MVPATVFCFMLAGISLWIMAFEGTSQRQQRKSVWHWFSRIGAAVITFVGVLRLIAYLFHWSLDLDYLFFNKPTAISNPASMSPATAFDFVLVGMALWLADTRWLKTFQFLVILEGFISWLGMSHFLFGGEPLFQFHNMAVHTSGAFLLLNIGILCLRTDGGLMALLVSDSAGGQIARRLVPTALIVPIILGWLCLEGEKAGFWGREASVALFALSNVLVFGGFIWANAARLDRADMRRKEAEQSLREREEQTRLIVETALDAVVTIDSDGVITGWNPQAEATFGWAGKEAIGHSLNEMIVPAQHRGAHEQGLRKYFATGEAVVLKRRIEITALHRDGHEFPVELAITPIQLGDRFRFSAFVRDITDRKQAEQKLKAQLAQLDLLNQITRAIGEHQDLQSIYQVVIGSLEDHLSIDFGCICLHDQVAKRLTVTSVGVRSEPLARELAMTNRTHVEIDRNGLSQCVNGQLVYEPDTSGSEFPFPKRLASGGLRSFVAAPLFVENQVFGVLVVARREPNKFSSGECEFLRQLSEHAALAAHQAQLHSALQSAYDDLRQTQQTVMQQERLRALGEMASGIAHDINNTLSPVMLYIGMLLEEEENLSAESRGHLEIVQRAVEDVAETIARLKEFYRRREPQSNHAPVQLNQLAQQVVGLTRARWNDIPQQRGIVIQIQTELAPDLPQVMGVESEIREALINLVFNAVDAMPKGGTLTLRTKVSDKNISVEVADTGTGMDEETRRRCLEPFYTTKGERGTGLGLAMVYGIIERHGADLEIESERGIGTTIKLIFPIKSSAIAAPIKSSTTASVLSRLRLLVVDDDPLLLKALRDILEADGHAVVTANGGQAGIDAFQAALKRNEPFSAAITDLGMPYVDGRAVASAIKSALPKTPLILLTGWGKRLASESDIPPHVNHVLSKPPKPAELREALARCVSTPD